MSRVVGDLHGPPVEEPDVTPACALADFDEVSTERRSRLHHGGDVVSSTDELFGMGENCLARLDDDHLVPGGDASFTEMCFIEKLEGWLCLEGFSPDGTNVCLTPRVVEAKEPFGFTLAKVVLSEGDVVARRIQVLSVERIDDDVAFLLFLENGLVGKSGHGFSLRRVSSVEVTFSYCFCQKKRPWCACTPGPSSFRFFPS